MRTTFRLIALCILMSAPAAAQQEILRSSQSPDSLQELRLGDGTRHVGHVTEATPDRLVFETIAGVRIEANRAFSRVTPVRGRVVGGEFWPEDRNATRLFFAPTGRSLRAGEGYAGAFVLLPFVAAGVTDDISLAGGIPLFGSLETFPFWVAPKVRVVDLPRAQISAGMFAVHTSGDRYDPETGRSRSASELAGIVYGVGTFGDDDNAVHAGGGVAFESGDWFGTVPLMLGGEMRVSRRNKLITENWLFPGEGGGVISGGVRMMGDRWTTDLGLAALIGDSNLPYFPIISFSYNFGR
jgi:hypothetical protein